MIHVGQSKVNEEKAPTYSQPSQLDMECLSSRILCPFVVL